MLDNVAQVAAKSQLDSAAGAHGPPFFPRLTRSLDVLFKIRIREPSFVRDQMYPMTSTGRSLSSYAKQHCCAQLQVPVLLFNRGTLDVRPRYVQFLWEMCWANGYRIRSLIRVQTSYTSGSCS